MGKFLLIPGIFVGQGGITFKIGVVLDPLSIYGMDIGDSVAVCGDVDSIKLASGDPHKVVPIRNVRAVYNYTDQHFYIGNQQRFDKVPNWYTGGHIPQKR